MRMTATKAVAVFLVAGACLVFLSEAVAADAPFFWGRAK